MRRPGSLEGAGTPPFRADPAARPTASPARPNPDPAHPGGAGSNGYNRGPVGTPPTCPASIARAAPGGPRR